MKSFTSIDSTDWVYEASQLLPLFRKTPSVIKKHKEPLAKPPALRFRRQFTEKDLQRIHYFRLIKDAKGRPMSYVKIGKRLSLRP